MCIPIYTLTYGLLILSINLGIFLSARDNWWGGKAFLILRCSLANRSKNLLYCRLGLVKLQVGDFPEFEVLAGPYFMFGCQKGVQGLGGRV